MPNYAINILNTLYIIILHICHSDENIHFPYDHAHTYRIRSQSVYEDIAT